MALIIILVVTYVISALMMSVSGSPSNDEKIMPEQKVAMEAKYGMDDPLRVQMPRHLKGAIVNQDFGVSLKIQKDRPALDIITEKLPLSAKIGVIALVWVVAMDIPSDCLATYNRGKRVDSVLRVVCTLNVSTPGPVVITSLLTLFCNDGASSKFMGINAIFDASQEAEIYLIPRLTLGLYLMCYIAHLIRSSMLNVLSQDYIRTARAKGLLAPGVIFEHALRNGAILIITYLGPLTAFTPMGGSVVEIAYTILGLGRYLVQSIQSRDYLIIISTTIFLATLAVIVNLVVDIPHRVVDLRTDLTKGEQE